MTQEPVFRIALDVPLRRLFDYLGPPACASPPLLEPGCRVRVPFGRQRLVGVVVEQTTTASVERERLKTVLEILDPQPVLDAATLALLRWAAEYYHHPCGEVILGALPKSLRAGAGAIARVEEWAITAAGRLALSSGRLQRAPSQRRVLEHLSQCEQAGAQVLGSLLPRWRESARVLAKQGWMVRSLGTPKTAAYVPADAPSHTRCTGPTPSAEQQAAVADIGACLGQFAAFVLHGVTGSGKTEVYLRLIERVLREGRAALVLVPEIGLTPQLVSRFRERLDAPLAVLHSALSEQERLLAWREAFSGRARIVLGTRSAVFAPLCAPGIIIVDEEHDASFKQHEGGFRYSARDLAVARAQREGVPVVLGSATPALETLHNAVIGRYTRLCLSRRADQARPPRMALIDLRASAVHAGISTQAMQAIERHLREDGQVLVFLNRRGYAPTLLCTACGWIAPCDQCDARMTVHRAAARLKCHHCGADTALPARCPQCGFATKPVGQGTERIEESLAAAFPEISLVRLDRDVVRRRGDMEQVMQRMASGEARILVGTQMVTKGHDFPNVTLVLVLNADQGLFSTDFRAAERLAQTIVQVAGRAGRGTRPGEVLIQTEFPEHPLLLNLRKAGYEGFARSALSERAQAEWPPFTRLAALRDSATTADAALEFLASARKLAEPQGAVKLLGPVPAAMSRRAGRYHAQLLIESADRGALHRFLEGWLASVADLPAARRVRWALDVDPIELF